jgi:hypothetical protein
MKEHPRFFLSSRSGVCLGKRQSVFHIAGKNVMVPCHPSGLVPLWEVRIATHGHMHCVDEAGVVRYRIAARGFM